MAPDGTLAAEVRGVVRCFGVGAEVVTALAGVDLAVERGRLTVVAGPSGSGKSTLLAIVACIQRPDEGTVTIGATDVLRLGRGARRRLRRDRLGVVLPLPSDNLLDHLDAIDNVRWAARRRRRASRDRQATTGGDGDADWWLDAVGLGPTRHRRVRELSGGEQQRLAVACALAGQPELVVLDEPTASLDRANAESLVNVLATLSARGSTMVVATHDPMVVAAADVLVELDHGRRAR